jgi:monoamine oxidase
MARTPLASKLQRSALQEDGGRRIDRRRLLRDAGALAVSASALGRLTPTARAATAPKIVVVGAGLAGLTCAYRLRQAGYFAELHEASDRVGGRCWTIRDAFQQGQIAEHGGELIDTGHHELRRLAGELKLDLVDLVAAEAAGTDEGY